MKSLHPWKQQWQQWQQQLTLTAHSPCVGTILSDSHALITIRGRCCDCPYAVVEESDMQRTQAAWTLNSCTITFSTLSTHSHAVGTCHLQRLCQPPHTKTGMVWVPISDLQWHSQLGWWGHLRCGNLLQLTQQQRSSRKSWPVSNPGRTLRIRERLSSVSTGSCPHHQWNLQLSEPCQQGWVAAWYVWDKGRNPLHLQ